MYNIANVGWQLVHYTVYGTQKSDNGLSFASSIIAFLHPVNCIVDSPPSNICILLNNLNLLLYLCSCVVVIILRNCIAITLS